MKILIPALMLMIVALCLITVGIALDSPLLVTVALLLATVGVVLFLIALWREWRELE